MTRTIALGSESGIVVDVTFCAIERMDSMTAKEPLKPAAATPGDSPGVSPDTSPGTSPGTSGDERELSAWMRLAQQGDSAAYQGLLRRLKSMAESFVRNTLGRKASWALSATEDIVQEILLGVHAKRHTYDPDRAFLPWFYAIARYKIIDHLRSGAKLPARYRA